MCNVGNRHAAVGGRYREPGQREIEPDRLVVCDEELGDYRSATELEHADPTTEKYLLDLRGEPYVYRFRVDRHARFGIRGDLYSLGPDKEDDTGDEIGN